MSNPHNLRVGQELWFVPDNRYGSGSPRAVEIAKIGRVWVTTRCQRRVNKDTLFVDGGGYSSPGRCYLSLEAWETELNRQAAWDAIRRAVNIQYNTPKDFDPIKLAEIERLLGITITERTSSK